MSLLRSLTPWVPLYLCNTMLIVNACGWPLIAQLCVLNWNCNVSFNPHHSALSCMWCNIYTLYMYSKVWACAHPGRTRDWFNQLFLVYVTCFARKLSWHKTPRSESCTYIHTCMYLKEALVDNLESHCSFVSSGPLLDFHYSTRRAQLIQPRNP